MTICGGRPLPAAVIHHRDNSSESTVDGAFIAVGTADAPATVRKFHMEEGLGIRSHMIEAFLDLWQLHRIGPDCPREVQFEAIARMREEGLIRHVGLSEVSVEDIEAAQKFFPVASVQNRYNLVDRTSEAVLAHCEQHGIGFIPWAPLDKGSLTGPGSALEAIAGRLGASGGAVALAWLLKRSPVMLPIPGTGDPGHLAQNAAGADLRLSDEDFVILDHAGREAWQSTSAG